MVVLLVQMNSQIGKKKKPNYRYGIIYIYVISIAPNYRKAMTACTKNALVESGPSAAVRPHHKIRGDVQRYGTRLPRPPSAYTPAQQTCDYTLPVTCTSRLKRRVVPSYAVRSSKQHLPARFDQTRNRQTTLPQAISTRESDTDAYSIATLALCDFIKRNSDRAINGVRLSSTPSAPILRRTLPSFHEFGTTPRPLNVVRAALVAGLGRSAPPARQLSDAFRG